MRRTALFACLAAGIVTLSATVAGAYSYRRPQDAATPGAPIQAQNGQGQYGHQSAPSAQNDVNFAWNGMEGPAYSYGYALNMPADGTNLYERLFYGHYHRISNRSTDHFHTNILKYPALFHSRIQSKKLYLLTEALKKLVQKSASHQSM